VERFDAQGTARLEDVVWNGNLVREGELAYAVTGAPAPSLSVELDAALPGVSAGGFAFDSAAVSVRHSGGRREGSARGDRVLYQDAGRDYRFGADYVLALDRSELVLSDVDLRFDTTHWATTRPGVVRWAGSGVEIEDIELVDGGGGRIFADGRLPEAGQGDL